MAARMPGERAEVDGFTVALAKALDHNPAAASTAARSPADGAALEPPAWAMSAVTMASVADALFSVWNGQRIRRPQPFARCKELESEPRRNSAMRCNRSVGALHQAR